MPPPAALKFQKDATRPGGGVFVVKAPMDKDRLENMPEGTIISPEAVAGNAGDGADAGSGTSGDEGEAPAAVSSEVGSKNDSLRSSLPPGPPPGSRSAPGSGVSSFDAPAWPPASASASASAPLSMAMPMMLGRGGAAHMQQEQQQHAQRHQHQHQHPHHHQMQQQQQQHAMQMQADQAGPSSMVHFTPLGGNFPNMNPALDNQMGLPENVQVMNVLDHPQGGNMNVLEQQAMADAGFLEGIPPSMFDWGTSAPASCISSLRGRRAYAN